MCPLVNVLISMVLVGSAALPVAASADPANPAGVAKPAGVAQPAGLAKPAGAVQSAGLAGAAGAEPDTPLVLDLVSAAGTGCPPGATAITTSADMRTFELSFGAFVAQFGPDGDLRNLRKTCQVSIDAHLPSGFTYAPAAMVTSGHLALADGVAATFKLQYRFTGATTTVAEPESFAGRPVGDWSAERTFADGQQFAPCRQPSRLTITMELRVSPPAASSPAGTASTTATSLVSVDRLAQVRFGVRRCPVA